MDIHKNARLTPLLRAELVKVVVEHGFTLNRAAARFNVSAKTAAKWVRRYREGGADSLCDRSSRPRRSPQRICEAVALQATELRRLRYQVDRIAHALKLSRATVSRIAFAAILPDQKHTSAILFLHMARAHFSRFGISCRALLSDNGSCYRHHRFQRLTRQLGLGHRYTRIYRPQTNGKAERFIQKALREWAYARSYQNSQQRTEMLELWLHDYNFHRPHASLNQNTPASRAGLKRNNLMTLHS